MMADTGSIRRYLMVKGMSHAERRQRTLETGIYILTLAHEVKDRVSRGYSSSACRSIQDTLQAFYDRLSSLDLATVAEYASGMHISAAQSVHFDRGQLSEGQPHDMLYVPEPVMELVRRRMNGQAREWLLTMLLMDELKRRVESVRGQLEVLDAFGVDPREDDPFAAPPSGVPSRVMQGGVSQEPFEIAC